MRLRHLILGLAALWLMPATAAASPACDLLRMCAAAIADEMARGPGEGCGQTWRTATIRQYRRMSVTALEQAGPGVCEAVYLTFANNVLGFYAHNEFCRIPPACKPDNLDDLPELPGGL